MACCGTSCGSGCGTGCGTGCGYGYGGGYGYGAGGGDAFVDNGPTSIVHVKPGDSSFIVPGPRLVPHCDTRVCCHGVCVSECCMPCGCRPCGCGHGDNGPGVRIDICSPSYDIVLPGGHLCSSVHCARVNTSCCDPCGDSCCGPC